MSIGFLGYIIILLSVWILLKRERTLLAIVFFAPFCASYVVAFDSFYLQPGHWFLLLYISIVAVSVFTNKRIRIPFKRANIFLFVFICYAFLTIIINGLLRTDVQVYGIGNANQLKSSMISFQNFTQMLYLFLGYLLYLCIFGFCLKNESNFRKVTRIFAISGLAVMAIGLYQMIANKFGLPYDEIFRNNVKNMWQTKSRMQATFGESSFFGQYCVYLFVIFATCKWSDNKIFRVVCLVLACVCGVMSRSTTFLLGVIGVVFTYVVFKKIDRKVMIKYLVAIITTPVLLVYIMSNNLYVQQLIRSTLSKITLVGNSLESHSGEERRRIFAHMLQVGLEHPFWGIGYGGGRSTDLYANILANVGIIGAFLFFAFIIRCLVFFIKNRNEEFSLCAILLLVGFLITSGSIPDLSYLPIWVLFGLVDSRQVQIKEDRRILRGIKYA